MTNYLIVQTTTDSHEAALQIAAALVAQRLAACVQVSGPITSVYRWNGKIEQGQEWICAAKTRADRFDDLAKAIRQLHSYDEPEIVATEIVAGAPSYLEWVERETQALP